MTKTSELYNYHYGNSKSNISMDFESDENKKTNASLIVSYKSNCKRKNPVQKPKRKKITKFIAP